jgi:hypothetical protein
MQLAVCCPDYQSSHLDNKNLTDRKQSRHNDSSVLRDILEVQISVSVIPLKSSIQHENQDE